MVDINKTEHIFLFARIYVLFSEEGCYERGKRRDEKSAAGMGAGLGAISMERRKTGTVTGDL